jgi:hypothetical protein
VIWGGARGKAALHFRHFRALIEIEMPFHLVMEAAAAGNGMAVVQEQEKEKEQEQEQNRSRAVPVR